MATITLNSLVLRKAPAADNRTGNMARREFDAVIGQPPVLLSPLRHPSDCRRWAEVETCSRSVVDVIDDDPAADRAGRPSGVADVVLARSTPFLTGWPLPTGSTYPMVAEGPAANGMALVGFPAFPIVALRASRPQGQPLAGLRWKRDRAEWAWPVSAATGA